MQLELKHIRGGELEQEYSCHPKEFPGLVLLTGVGDSVYRDPVLVKLRFVQSGRLIEVSGYVQATLDLICGCCLSPFTFDLAEEFALSFVPESTLPDLTTEVELETDELALIPYREDRLELLVPVQEQLLMAVPMHPLCLDDCKGLCPDCGVDLNKTACHCEKKVFNSKFGDLAHLKGREV